MSNLTFVTSVTNNEYVTFLRAHLLTITRWHPGARVIVHYERITHDRIAALKVQFPKVNFQTAVRNQARASKAHTIGGKVGHYLDALEHVPDGAAVVLIDCDTLICRPIDHYFYRRFDVAFTWKTDGYPLNSGVMLGRAGSRLSLFLAAWEKVTQEIFADRRLLRLASSQAGGADQYSLSELVTRYPAPESFVASSPEQRRREFDGETVRSIEGEQLTVLGVEARYLNETRSCPITPDTHVIHYKSGWHRIVLRGEPFHGTRPEAESREMFQYWLDCHLEAERRSAEAVAAAAVTRRQRCANDGGDPLRVLDAAANVARVLGVHRVVMLSPSCALSITGHGCADLDVVMCTSPAGDTLTTTLSKLVKSVRASSNPTLLAIDLPDDTKAGLQPGDVVQCVLRRCPQIAGALLRDRAQQHKQKFPAYAHVGFGETGFALVLPGSQDLYAASEPAGLRRAAAMVRIGMRRAARTVFLPRLVQRLSIAFGG